MHAHGSRVGSANGHYAVDQYPLYSRDADRAGPSMSTSACTTPRSLASHSSGSVDVSPGRVLIPRDIQSPAQVVAQIRGAHNKLLYLSRTNFAQPNALGEADQAAATQDWQQSDDQPHDQSGLDRISEMSDSTYMQERSQSGTPHSSASTHDRAQELYHANDVLNRQLAAMHLDMEQQQHEHFKMRQEQHLHLEDLRAHVSHLQNQLKDNQDNTAELLNVNSFLEAQLKKHKDQTHTARQSTLRYHRQLQQDQQERTQLSKQLQDTQAQLAEAWRDSNQQQHQVHDLQKQLAAAAEHKATASQLSASVEELLSTNEGLTKSKDELTEANRGLSTDNQALTKARDSLTADLRDVNLQLTGLQTALTEAFREQEALVKHAQHSVIAQHAQQAAAAAEKLSAATEQNQQLEAQVADLHQKLEHIQALPAQLSEVQTQNQQLEAQVADLHQKLEHTQALPAQLSELQTHSQQLEAQVSHLQQQLEQDRGLPAQVTELQMHNQHLEEQLAGLRQEHSQGLPTELQAQSQPAEHQPRTDTPHLTQLTQDKERLQGEMARQLQGAQTASLGAGRDAAHIVHTAAGQISLDALQPTLSGVSEEEYSRLKDENQALADRLANAEHAVAEQLEQQQAEAKQQQGCIAQLQLQVADRDQLAQYDMQLELQLQQAQQQLHSMTDQLEQQQAVTKQHQDDMAQLQQAEQQLQGLTEQLEQQQALIKQQQDDTAQLQQTKQQLQGLTEQLEQQQALIKQQHDDTAQLQQTKQQLQAVTEHLDQQQGVMSLLQGQLADAQEAVEAQDLQVKALQVEKEKEREAASAQQAKQAVVHAKEVTQLTDAHQQMQALVTTLTEENAQLDKANTSRGMHIGNLSAGLDQFKQKLKHVKSATSVDHMPEVSPVELPNQDDSLTLLHSELADLQKKQSSRSLQITDSRGTDTSSKLSKADSDAPSTKPSADAAADAAVRNDQDLEANASQYPEGEVNTLTVQARDLQSEVDRLGHQLSQAQELSKELRDAQQAEHAEQMAALKTQFECLLEDYTSKDQQVQELMSKCTGAAAPDAQQAQAANESAKVSHLTDVNKQLEDHVTSLDAQLEQLQQELEAASTEGAAAASHAQASLQTALEAERAQHEKKAANHRAELEALHEECSTKALQVQQLLTSVDQLTDERDSRESQVRKLQAEVDQLNEQADRAHSRGQQMEEQLEALQQEHHRLTESHMGAEKNNGLLQEECNQLQGYISVLDEDLGKAQERIGNVLAVDETSAARQNEMLKAAAKQVIQIRNSDAKRSKIPKLLRKFSSRKKERGSYTFEEPITPKSPPMLPNSPRATQVALPPQTQRQSQTNTQTPSYPYPPASPRAAGDGAHIVHTAAGQISLDALQPTLSSVSEEEHSRLKDENQALADRLANAEHAVAELNSRLVDAAFGADTGKGRSLARSVSNLDNMDAGSYIERDSSVVAPSGSSDYVSIAGMPPGVPLDPIYD